MNPEEPLTEEQLLDWIAEGEHDRQDFKFAINDQRKIAIALVAFANSKGGRLLVGVKDNGRIAGVRDEEELYMVEGAAQLYSRPEIPFTARTVEAEEKTVLVVDIPASKLRPHQAQDAEGHWLAYYREGDENRKAHPIQISAWKHERRGLGRFLELSPKEDHLMKLLKENPRGLSASALSKATGITRQPLIRTLGHLYAWGLIQLTEEQGITLVGLKR